MAQAEPRLWDLTAAHRDAILHDWLTLTFRTYPEQTSRFLHRDQDPFRNPVGRVLGDGLPVLLDELTGAFDQDRVAPVVESIVRIRAVQDFTPSQAVGFFFFLKQIIRERRLDSVEPPAALFRRIDELALMAFDSYMRCRELTYEIKANEAKRRLFVSERMASGKAGSSSRGN